MSHYNSSVKLYRKLKTLLVTDNQERQVPKVHFYFILSVKLWLKHVQDAKVSVFLIWRDVACRWDWRKLLNFIIGCQKLNHRWTSCMVTWFVETWFLVNINVIFKPHTEDNFSKNTKKETIMSDVRLAQFLVENLDQLQNLIIWYT